MKRQYPIFLILAVLHDDAEEVLFEPAKDKMVLKSLASFPKSRFSSLRPPVSSSLLHHHAIVTSIDRKTETSRRKSCASLDRAYVVRRLHSIADTTSPIEREKKKAASAKAFPPEREIDCRVFPNVFFTSSLTPFYFISATKKKKGGGKTEKRKQETKLSQQ